MLLVPSTLMRSLGGGAILVAIASVLAALTLLPALLRLLGDRVNQAGGFPTAHPGREPKRWAALARAVIRRPWIAAGLGIAILLTLAAPASECASPSRARCPPRGQPRSPGAGHPGGGLRVGPVGHDIAIENASGSGAAIEALAAHDRGRPRLRRDDDRRPRRGRVHRHQGRLRLVRPTLGGGDHRLHDEIVPAGSRWNRRDRLARRWQLGRPRVHATSSSIPRRG